MHASHVDASCREPPVSAPTTTSGGHGQLYMYLGRRNVDPLNLRVRGGAVILT